MSFRRGLPAVAAIMLLYCSLPAAAAVPYSWKPAISSQWEIIRISFLDYIGDRNSGSPSRYDNRIMLADKIDSWSRLVVESSAPGNQADPEVTEKLRASAVPPANALSAGLRTGESPEVLALHAETVGHAVLSYARDCLEEQNRVNRLLLYMIASLLLLSLLVTSLIVSFRSRYIRSALNEAHSADFARQIIRVQEAERAAFARELHDTIAQDMLCIKMATESIRRSISRLDARYDDSFVRLLEQETDCIHQIRNVCTELRPPELEHLGLKPALASLCENFEQRSGIRCLYLVSGFDAIGPEREIHCYRIVQEALNNVRKHSQAKEALVQLTGIRDSRICILIEDDGIGFDPESVQSPGSKKFGLTGIRERIRTLDGSLVIKAARGGGTSIFATIPLTPETIAF